jgi:hypothetical protein
MWRFLLIVFLSFVLAISRLDSAIADSAQVSHQNKRSDKRKKFLVAVLQRIDGSGLRKILNLGEVIWLTQSILNVSSVELWYIDGEMPAVDQARRFRSFDVLIATHSSQLTNLVFSRPGSSVIEIQPEHGAEPTFLHLGQQVGLRYHFLNKGHNYTKNGFPDENWRQWDYTVNLDELASALHAISIEHSSHPLR